MSDHSEPAHLSDDELMNSVADLVSLAKAGDQHATENLFAQFRGYLLLIANEELGRDIQGKFGASDFVQETMLIAHRKFQHFRGETVGELKGWLRQILRNDLNRVRKRFTTSKKREISREMALDDSVFQPNPVDRQNTPQSNALINEESALLDAALSRLPENYQTAIRLREWDELSYPEIGTRMGTTEEAARKLCHRAMSKLEAVLKQLMNQGRPTPPRTDD